MAEDDESDVLTYTLSGGADMASFKVDPLRPARSR